jgi:hypothetical protein
VGLALYERRIKREAKLPAASPTACNAFLSRRSVNEDRKSYRNGESSARQSWRCHRAIEHVNDSFPIRDLRLRQARRKHSIGRKAIKIRATRCSIDQCVPRTDNAPRGQTTSSRVDLRWGVCGVASKNFRLYETVAFNSQLFSRSDLRPNEVAAFFRCAPAPIIFLLTASLILL